MIDKALKIAVEAHKGVTDRDGEPYILHPLRVGLMGTTDEERMAGFLHDVVEDSPDWTFEQLLEEGIPTGVVNALRLLTHDKAAETYADYVGRIIASGNPIALKVKLNDLTHNYERGKAYPDLQAKHGPQLERVRAAWEALNRVDRYELTDPTHTAVFAGGCFWGVQHMLERQPGVLRTLVGYSGGSETNPTYETVRSHRTTHVEAVLVEFDPSVVSYTALCRLFFEIHDFSQDDGQGPDKGAQYLSRIFYTTAEQREEAQAIIDHLQQKGHTVATKVLPYQPFWVGEKYHQAYYAKTGGEPYCHVRRRLEW